MLKTLRIRGVAQDQCAVTEQSAPAIEAALPILSQLLRAKREERICEVEQWHGIDVDRPSDIEPLAQMLEKLSSSDLLASQVYAHAAMVGGQKVSQADARPAIELF